MNWSPLQGCLGSYADDEQGNRYFCVFDSESNNTYELYVELRSPLVGHLGSEQYLGRFIDFESAYKKAEEHSKIELG